MCHGRFAVLLLARLTLLQVLSSSVVNNIPAQLTPPFPLVSPRLGHCAGRMEGSVSPSSLPSHVHLNFTTNVVVIQPGSVLEMFERAVAAFSRPEDPDHETGPQQVMVATISSACAVAAANACTVTAAIASTCLVAGIPQSNSFAARASYPG